MINATQARQVANEQALAQAREDLLMVKDVVEAAVLSAVKRGMVRAEVRIGRALAPSFMGRIKQAYTTLGYDVRVEQTRGMIGGGVYVSPGWSITLSWEDK